MTTSTPVSTAQQEEHQNWRVAQCTSTVITQLLELYVSVLFYSNIYHSVLFAVIPFKTEMAVELQEKGRVRFWAQVAKFTSKCQVEYVFNDNIITQGKV